MAGFRHGRAVFPLRMQLQQLRMIGAKHLAFRLGLDTRLHPGDIKNLLAGRDEYVDGFPSDKVHDGLFRIFVILPKGREYAPALREA